MWVDPPLSCLSQLHRLSALPSCNAVLVARSRPRLGVAERTGAGRCAMTSGTICSSSTSQAAPPRGVAALNTILDASAALHVHHTPVRYTPPLPARCGARSSFKGAAFDARGSSREVPLSCTLDQWGDWGRWRASHRSYALPPPPPGACTCSPPLTTRKRQEELGDKHVVHVAVSTLLAPRASQSTPTAIDANPPCPQPSSLYSTPPQRPSDPPSKKRSGGMAGMRVPAA